MNADDFGAGACVLVIGLGRSGVASCNVLRSRGATVYATDDKDPAALSGVIDEIERSGAIFMGPKALHLARGLTAAVLSPGVPLTNDMVRSVQAARVPVYSEIEVAYRICAAPIVAVSGTKGKTTTTALIGELFRHAGRSTRVGGNIGNALISETAVAKPEDWVIAEVSSFQLEGIRAFKPRIAVLLNLMPDHLDRYHSMEEYTEAKLRIFANQGPGDAFIGNLDDPAIGALAEGDGASRIPSRAYWFGLTPRRMTTLYVRRERITFAPATGDPRPVDVMPVSEIPLLGEHNVANVLAAILVGLIAGIEPEELRAGVRAFKPLPHRLQTVADVGGLLFVDDSKSTAPGSVVAALESFDRPIVLIAGGKSKGVEFRDMGAAIDRKAKAVVLIGEAGDEIAKSVSAAQIVRAPSMEEAVRLARSLAQPGDVVLLSPGCASFDMFNSAEERGEVFTRAVGGEAVAHG